MQDRFYVTRFHTFTVLAALGVLGVVACEEATAPTVAPSVHFGAASLALGEDRNAMVLVRNTGTVAAGPVEIAVRPVRKAGVEIPGATVLATPDELPTLNPGDSALVALQITGATDLQSGTYLGGLEARVGGEVLDDIEVSFLVAAPITLVGSIQIVNAPAAGRQGDVLQLEAVVYDTLGAVLDGAQVTWTTLPAGGGFFTADAEFAPYATGTVPVVASVGGVADTVEIEVTARGVGGTFSIVANGPLTNRYTSDLWLHGGAALTGTWGFRSAPGNTVYAWNTAGGTPVVTDSVTVEASTVNDVKISADGSFAVVSQERGGGGSHAVTILDLSDPLHPDVAGEFSSDVADASWVGIHNLWIDGDHVYLVVDGTAPNRGLWIIDVSDPSAPERVAQFHGGSSFLHDVYVRDGLAFLSHWNAGLIILDVGNGIVGGSPTSPVEVSRVTTVGGQTHNAWYWPEAGYVFVGEEDFGTPGMMHVVDVSDLQQPVEVASYRVASDTPHNFWLDEDAGVLYMAWYTRGLQAVDVTGQLLGSLDLQGRTVATSEYDEVGGCPGGGGLCTWAPQLHDGFVYVSDMNTGIWKLQPNF